MLFVGPIAAFLCCAAIEVSFYSWFVYSNITETATKQWQPGKAQPRDDENGVKGLREASVPIQNGAQKDTIEMEREQHGMAVNGFASAQAESGSTVPQVVRFQTKLHRTVMAQQLDQGVILFAPRDRATKG